MKRGNIRGGEIITENTGLQIKGFYSIYKIVVEKLVNFLQFDSKNQKLILTNYTKLNEKWNSTKKTTKNDERLV